MLHASFCKFDGFRDPKNRLWRLQNLPKSSSKHFKSPPKNHFEALLLQRTPSNLFFSKNNDFWPVFGLQNGSKIQIKRLKINVEKQYVFGDDFSWKFLHFGLQKWTPNQRFCVPLSKTPILQKPLFFLGEIAIFQVRRLKKTNRNRCKNALQNNIEKKDPKIKIWHPFWSPKTSKIAPNSDVKRSLFRDAMELTRASAEIYGPQRL